MRKFPITKLPSKLEVGKVSVPLKSDIELHWLEALHSTALCRSVCVGAACALFDLSALPLAFFAKVFIASRFVV